MYYSKTFFYRRNVKSEEIKNIFKEILYNSFAQAIIKIIQTPHVILKIFLLSFVISTSGYCSYLVIKSIMTYFSFGVWTTSRTVYETPTLFPKVTFCNLNQLQTKHAYDLHEMDAIADGNYLSNEEKKKFGHDLEDILVECRFNDYICDSTNFTWSFDTWHGNCFTFNSDEFDLKTSTISGPFYGLRLGIYVNLYEKFLDSDLVSFQGALVRIGNSSYSTYYSAFNGILLSPGTVNNIVVDREFKKILPRPYSNCEIDSNSPKFIQGLDLYNLISQSDYKYTQQLCFLQCWHKHIILKYKCVNSFFLSLVNGNECTQEVNDVIYNSSEDIFSSEFINKECLPVCPLECDQTFYKTSHSSSVLNENSKFYKSIIRNSPTLAADFISGRIDGKRARESFVYLNIYYNSLSYTLTTESPQLDGVTLLGSIGGNLGLFLGVSVFSLCELVAVAVEIFYFLK